MEEPLFSTMGVMQPVVGPRVRVAALGLTVTVLIMLVVLASRSSTVPIGTEQVNSGPVTAIVHLIVIVGIALEIVSLVLWLVLSRLARRRPEEEEDQIYHEPPRLHWAIRLIIATFPLLILGGLIYALFRFRSADQPLLPALIDIFAPAPGTTGATEPGVVAPFELAWWEYAIALALAGLALGAIVWAFRPVAAPPRPQPAPRSRARILSRAVAASLDDVRRERDPRRAVIAAYATMERILAAQGLPRREVEAPLEYMTRLFAEFNVDSDAIRTLTDLFELARFSHHVIVPAMKERAISALVILGEELQPAP